MGADVVKIESPQGGDYARFTQPLIGEVGAIFASVNRNKRSVALDLKSPAGASALRRLLATADVLVESFRPGVMARLGLGPDTVKEQYPDLIVCSISGYGQTGPARTDAGHDNGYLARAGVLDGIGVAGGPRVLAGVQIADLGGGALYAATAVCAALFGRERSTAARRGCWIDISMTDGALSFLLPLLTMVGHGHEYGGPGGEMLNGGIPCYAVYETKDGKHMALGALEPKFWFAFCSAAGVPDLVSDGYAQGDDGERVAGRLAALFKTRDRDEWSALLEAADCCCVPVKTPDEVVSDPLFVERGLFFEVEGSGGPVFQTATPLTPADRERFTPPPLLGEHTREVLCEVGYGEAELDAMISDGAAASR
jgi:crotonobetainyl-CoA:carnitine CoA-transferase CaiB-like acyl-CoA transferase